MKIHSYPTVHALHHIEIVDILNGYVFVQEKIDGSQISFIKDDKGLIHIRSKKVEIFDADTSKMFALGVDTIYALDLQPNIIYRGEYLQKPKHNVLSYEAVPKGNIILFDIEEEGQRYWDFTLVAEEATRLGLLSVPLLYQGLKCSLELLKELISSSKSILGGRIEGVVIKNYNQFTREKKIAIGKLVSEEFKEVHGKEWRKSNPTNKDVVADLTFRLRTEGRWLKAIQHLRDNGTLTNSPQDIGPLMKEINQDVLKEEEETIKKILFKHFWPHIGRGLTAGFPEWYKEKCATDPFSSS